MPRRGSRLWGRGGAVLLFFAGILVAGAGAAFAYWAVGTLYAPTNYAVAQAGTLSAPTAPTATVNSSSTITVGWTLPATQLTGAQYRVTRTTGTGSPATVCTVAATATSCQDTGLTAGAAYGYSVNARIGTNWQSTAITISATTLSVSTTSLPGGDVGTAYSAPLAATGGTGTYSSWALTAGTLPAGLTLNTSTGTVFGNPSTPGTSSGLQFTVTDSHGATATSGLLSIIISSAPSVTTTTLATATRSQVGYSQTLTSAGGTAPITWSISTGTLPAGLTLAPSTGVISGTVGGAATTQPFTVVATDANAVAASKSLTITVNAAPSVTTTTLATATQGQVGYSQTLTSAGGTAPITWSISTGTLPAGLTLAPSTGVISGTVGGAATTQPFTVVATDANAVAASKSLTITVNAAPSVTTTTLATATQGQVGYSQTLTSAGGTAPITWSISTGTLPAGLTLAPSTGVISGTVGGAATTQPFTVVATDANAVAASKSLTITVNAAPSVTTTTLATATQGQVGYSQTLTSAGGTAPITWSISTGTLPAGLTLAPSTGVISGTVGGAATTQPFTVVATDANAVAASKSLTINVNTAPTVSFALGGTNGAAGNGQVSSNDTVTLQFSGQMDATTLCSAWDNSGTQTLSGNNAGGVFVTITNNGSNDTLSVTSGQCTFNFGSIALNANYVTATTTFAGNGGGQSSITLGTDGKLVIKLGSGTSGSQTNVSASIPVYTPAAGLKDIGGSSLATTPVNGTSSRF